MSSLPKKTAAVAAAAAATALTLSAAPASAAEAPLLQISSTAAVRDASGSLWSSAAGFVGGRTATPAPAGTDIRSTTDDALYRAARFGMTGFNAAVASGTYDVTLKMSENFFTTAGRRVFDVTAEGSTVLSRVDIVAAAGRYAAYDRTFRVKVSDGSLSLGFVRHADNPLVSAIEIVPVDTTAPETTVTRTAAGGTAPAGASFTFGSNEPGSTFSCSKDGGAWAGCTSPVTLSGLGAGAHTFSVKATDAAGNVDPISASSSWNVAAPVVTTPAGTGGSKPDASNTGVPSGVTLKKHVGDLVVTTPGATFDSLDIHGFVTIKAPNVKITRSIIRGGVATGNTGLVTIVDRNASNFVIEDSTLVPSNPSVWIDGLKGWNFTARRVDISGTTDNIKVHGAGNVLIEKSWLHDSKYFTSDPNHGGKPSHNDGVQILGGDNIRVIGNSISGANNAAVQVTQQTGLVTGFEFSGNWADGGGCTMNLYGSGKTLSSITIKNNRFGRNTRNADCAIIAPTSNASIAMSANVWDDNGQPVRVRAGS